jgi:hypothetical protein
MKTCIICGERGRFVGEICSEKCRQRDDEIKQAAAAVKREKRLSDDNLTGSE